VAAEQAGTQVSMTRPARRRRIDIASKQGVNERGGRTP